MAGKQFETLQGFRAKPSLVVNCCVTQTHAALLLRERKNVVLLKKKKKIRHRKPQIFFVNMNSLHKNSLSSLLSCKNRYTF